MYEHSVAVFTRHPVLLLLPHGTVDCVFYISSLSHHYLNIAAARRQQQQQQPQPRRQRSLASEAAAADCCLKHNTNWFGSQNCQSAKRKNTVLLLPGGFETAAVATDAAAKKQRPLSTIKYDNPMKRKTNVGSVFFQEQMHATAFL